MCPKIDHQDFDSWQSREADNFPQHKHIGRWHVPQGHNDIYDEFLKDPTAYQCLYRESLDRATVSVVRESPPTSYTKAEVIAERVLADCLDDAVNRVRDRGGMRVCKINV